MIEGPIPEALTFDDVLLLPGKSAVLPAQADTRYDDPTLRHLASTPGLPPEVVRGLIALARNWRQDEEGNDGLAERRA